MSDLRMFELIEPLQAEGSASARLLVWNGSRYVPEGNPIAVFDFVGSHGMPGDRGYCFMSSRSRRWEAASGLFAQEYSRLG